MDDKAFWNDHQITDYFASKPADPRIVAFLNTYRLPPNAHALDLGCGGGRHTELLAREKFRVSAIDVNPEMLITTQNRLHMAGLRADIHNGSIAHIPYDDSTFDIVIATGVLHQALSVNEYGRAIDELARVMKPQGYALINIFTNKAWDDTYEVLSDDGYTVRTKEGLGMTLLPRRLFVEMMAARNLELYDEQGEDTKMENTGPRAVYRAFFVKYA